MMQIPGYSSEREKEERSVVRNASEFSSAFSGQATLPPIAGAVLKSTPASNVNGGEIPPLPNFPRGFAFTQELPPPIRIPVEQIPSRVDEIPLYEILSDGSMNQLRELDREELTPFGQKLYDVLGPNAVLDALYTGETTDAAADVRRQMFARMDAAREMLLVLPEQDGAIASIQAKTGLSPDAIRYFQESDPDYLKAEVEKYEVLAASGIDGYTAQQMQNPQSRQMLRFNAVRMAEIEADLLGIWGSTREHIDYDLRVGVGQVGTFASNAAAGIGQLLADAVDLFTHPLVKAGKQEAGWARRKAESLKEHLGEAAKDNAARWLGPAIDTGNPWTDWLRTSIFQGAPFLAGSVGLAMVTGPAGAAGIIAGGMGLETYGETRAAGVSPLLAAAAAAGTFATSYFVNRFQLDRWTRNLAGRAPFRQFSVGAAVETAQEFGSESLESLGQGFFGSSAKLLGGPGYTRDDWWRDMKESALGALQEGAAAGTLSMVTRLFGLPAAVRNQARAYQFNNAFKDMGTKAKETTLYQDQPLVLAQEINNTARHHGFAGIVFSSAMELEQGGLTRQELCDGLGISREEFDFSKANNVDLAIPVGNAVVFAQQQADSGNTYFQDVLRADPDAMTGREIAEQAREVAATLEVAEQKFKALGEGNDAKLPLRLRTFRAGLRAFGFSVNEADAATAMFWSRAERAAELWGVSAAAWLDQRNVQLEMESILQNSREMKRYQELVKQVEMHGTAQDIFAEDEAAQPDVSGMDDNTTSSEERSAANPATQQNGAGEVVDTVQELAQPVSGEEANNQWVDAAVDELAAAFGIQGEEFASLRAAAHDLLQQGENNLDVRAMAEQMGVALPSAVESSSVEMQPITRETGARDPTRVEEIRAKYDKMSQLSASTEEVAALPKNEGVNKPVIYWIEEKGLLRDDYVNLDTGWSDIHYRRSSIRSVLNHSAGDGKLGLLPIVPELIRDGVYLESMERNDQGHIGHVFAAKAEVDGVLYMVGFTINEDMNGRRYYNHEMAEMEMVPGQSPTRNAASRPAGTVREPIINILRAYLDVNQGLSVLEEHYQTAHDGSRGAIRFQSSADAPTIIKLFKGADVSTVIHELNHLFVFDLQQMVAAGKGGERARADLAALTEFAGGKLDRAGYERIAQAWERYAMEGRAPSPDLYDAFDTFRKYMSRIYKNATQIGAEPSANVRAVFDRFLATDAEIGYAAQLYQQSEQWWENLQNMDGAAKERLCVMHERAKRAERQRSDANSGGKALGRLAGLDLNKVREQIRGREANSPVYRAASSAKEQGGLDRATVEQIIGKPAAEAIAARHGQDIYGGSIDMTRLAVDSGFKSPMDMLTSLSATESLEEAVDAGIRAGLDAEDRACADSNETHGDEVHKDETDAEEEFLREQAETAVKLNGGGARALREWRIKYQAKKIAAERSIGAMDMHQAMDLRRFEKAKRDAQKAADRAVLKGDMKEHADYRDQVLLHHLMVRECQKACAMNERVRSEYGTRSLLAKLQADQYHPRVEDAYAETIKDLATFMGFTDNRKTRPATESETLSLPAPEPGSNVSEFLPNLAGTLEPWMLGKTRPADFMSYRDFTFNQVKEADRVLKLLFKHGRGELHALKDLGVANLEELVSKSVEPMQRREPRSKQKDDRNSKGRIRNAVSDFFISITTPETWFMMMDGNPTIQGKEAGINQRMFWALRDCQVEKDLLYKNMMDRLKPHFANIEQAKAEIEAMFGGKTFLVPGVPVPDVLKSGRDYQTWDANMLIATALNMGNDANIFALKAGYGFSDAQLQTIGQLFTVEQWQAIQGVWDAIDSLYPQLDAVTFRITNRHVPKELAQAFTVEARGGEVVQMKGGYFPLVYDPMLSDRAGQYADLENAIYKGQMENIHASTRPADGMLKERARDENGSPVVGRPQLLRTNIIVQHLDAALHYITHAEKILEFDRLTRNATWKTEFVDKFGEHRYRALRNWVQDLARPKRLNNDPVSRIMNKARDLATINALGLRFSTGLKQRQGLFNAAAFMQDSSRTGAWGWKYVLKGMREIGFAGNFGAKTARMREIDVLSNYMAARDGGHDREIRAMVEKLSPLDAHFTIPGTSLKVEKKKFHDYMFAWIQANDRAASYAVWAGAYAQAMNGDANFDISGMTDQQRQAEAVKFADAAAATQASSFAADLTAMQRGDGIGRFLGMFMSGNVRQGSRLMQYLDAYQLGDKSAGDVALLACREFAFPALAWVFMASAIKMALGNDEDDLFAEAMWEVAETAIAPFPLLREIPSSLRYGPTNLAAVEMPTRAVGQVFGAPGKIADGKAEKALFDLVSGVGFFVGFPLNNPVREARPLAEAAGIVGKK